MTKIFKRLTRKFLVGTIGVIIISAPIIYILLINASKTEAAWFNDNWLYRKAITVTVTTNASDISNLETLLTVDTTGITDKLQASCQDLRFTNTSGNLLPYYIDTCSDNSATNKVWVMADLVPKNTTTYTLYMYYGNSSAKSNSDANKFWAVRDLEAYWTLNDTSGNRTDSSVNGNTLTDTNTVTSNTGQYSNAGQFTASSSESLTVADNASISTGDIDYTLTGWVYADTLPAGSFLGVIGKNSTASNAEYSIDYKTFDSTNRFRFFVSGDGSNSTGVSADSLGAATTGTWYFIVAWHDSVANTINIQVNNGTVDSASHTTGGFDGTSPIVIGASNQNWNGRMDDIRFYKRILTPDEKTKLYTNPGTIATTAVGTSGPSTSFASEEQAPAPVAYWKFDDGTGTNANDSTSNNLDGTISGATWQIEDQCIAGKCLYFDGSNDSINIADNSALEPTRVTVSSWVRITGTPDASHGGGILSKGLTGNNEGSYEILVDSDFRAYFRAGDLSDETVVTPANTLTQNKWHFITGVYDGSNIYIYVDGNLIDSDAATGSLSYDTGSLKIGVRGNGLGPFPGFIDESKIYPFAKTAAQVKSDFSSQGSVKGISSDLGSDPQNNSALSNGLVGYWKMNEASWTNDCSTTSVTDSSGNGNNGKSCPNAGGVTTLSSGKFGNAPDFDGTNDEVNIPDSTSLSITGTLTLSAWINPDSVSADQTILEKGEGTVGTNSYLIYTTSAGKFALNIRQNSGLTDDIISNTSISTGTWTHIVATWDGSTANLYINGILDKTATTTTTTIQDTTAQFGIGGIPASAAWPYNGKVDEARVYNRALSSADVSALYNFAPGPISYWDFDNNSGTSASDKSGNGNNATLQAGANWAPGKYGSAANLDGSNDYISSSSPGATQSFTVSGWYNSAGNSGTSFLWETSAGASAPSIEGTDSGQTFWMNNTNQLSTGAMNTNRWYYVTATYDAATSTQSLYVDGVLKGTNTSVAEDDIGTTMYIGSRSGSGFFWKGKVDDFKIYNYARTQQQIVSDMNAGHPAVGSPVGSAIGHWRFDEGTDNTCSGGANDACNSGSLGSTLDAAQSNMASPATSTSGWTNSGKFGKALIFDGTNDFATMAGTGLNASTGTVSLWFYRTGTGTTTPVNGDHNYLFSNPATGTNSRIYFRFTPAASTTLQGVLGDATVIGSTTVENNTWNHAALTWNGTSGSFYLNGRLISTTTFNGMTSFNATTYLASFTGTTNPQMFAGTLDEVKIYSYDLTADQVKQDMNRGQSQVLGTLSDNSSYEKQAANQVYCIPGDSTSCVAPVGEWDFETGTGSTVFDRSGNANTGSWQGTLGSQWKPGKYGTAGNLNGSDNYIDIGDLSSTEGVSTFTREFWIKPTSLGVLKCLICKFNSGTTQTAWATETGVLDSSIVLASVSSSATDGSSYGETPTGALSVNTWTHVTVVFDGTLSGNANRLKIYINGTQKTLTFSGTIPSSTQSTTSNAVIGASSDGSRLFNGMIDQVRIFNYARTAAQIAWDYNKGAPVGHWKFNECQGTLAYDSSGNGYTGTITPDAGGQTAVGTCTGSAGTMWKDGAIGKYNSSLDFDGIDDSLDIGLPLGSTSSGTKTVSAWIYPTNTADGYIMTNYDPSSHGFSVLFNADRTVGIAWTGTVNAVRTTDAIPLNSWTHVVGVFETGATGGKIYLNGKQSKTGNLGTEQTTTNRLKIGSRWTGVNTGAAAVFTGQIDETQIYNYTLTATQIKTLFNQGGAIRFGPSTPAP